MRPHRPGPPPAAVLSRGHRRAAAVLALALAVLLPPLLPAPVLAQETGRKDEAKTKETKTDGAKKEAAAKAPKKSEDEILLEALAASWKKGDATTLAKRFPGKRRVSLRLPGSEAGDYRAGQATSILAEYFKDRTFSKVARKSVKETAGTFTVEYVRASDRRTVRAELLLVVGMEEENRVLVSVRESP